MERPTERRGTDEGFSMVELLVVIVILGLLAAIAIPLYLDQQNKARDAAAQSDAMNLGLAIRLAWDQEEGVSSVTWNGSEYLINGQSALASSSGVEFVQYTGSNIEDWCVELKHPGGDKANNPGVKFDSQNGYVEQASC